MVQARSISQFLTPAAILDPGGCDIDDYWYAVEGLARTFFGADCGFETRS
jgi:hypothetical protein